MQHFRCHVLGRAAERAGLAVLGPCLLGQAEVRQPDVAVHVDKDVLRLEVSVDNVVVVKKLEGQDEHGCVQA